jgi:hypothetical protein
LDTQKLRELLDHRDAIDAEIFQIVTGNGTKKERKPQVCSKCGSPDHTARTCPQKELAA